MSLALAECCKPGAAPVALSQSASCTPNILLLVFAHFAVTCSRCHSWGMAKLVFNTGCISVESICIPRAQEWGIPLNICTFSSPLLDAFWLFSAFSPYRTLPQASEVKTRNASCHPSSDHPGREVFFILSHPLLFSHHWVFVLLIVSFLLTFFCIDTQVRRSKMVLAYFHFYAVRL